jgi:Zn-dependent membrane protease YugP
MKQLIPVQQVASMVLMATPLVFAFTRSPMVMIIEIVAALGIMASTVLVHLFTLPTEFDASFNRALPALKHFIDEEDQQSARKVLRAAAFTYVAGALANLLNILRWARRF